MGKKVEEVDPTAWMIDNDIANFLLLHQKEVLYMCMVSYVSPCYNNIAISLSLICIGYIFISISVGIYFLAR